MPEQRSASSFAIVIAVTLTACAQPSPTVPSAPVLVVTPVSAITISGLPSSVTLGESESFQLTASVTLPDGSHKQTLDAVWQSSNTAVATVSPSGLLTIFAGGGTDVSATTDRVSTTRHLVVQNPAPPWARMRVTSNGYVTSQALPNVSRVMADLSESTGFNLKHEIRFGDGFSATGLTATHIYAPTSQGTTYEIRGVVTDGLGRTSNMSQDIYVVGLSNLSSCGRWVIRADGKQTHEIDARSGDYGWTAVTGGLKLLGRYSRIVEPFASSDLIGTVSAGGAAHFAVSDGSVSFDGELVWNLNGEKWMDLTVRGGPDDRKRLKFHYLPVTNC